jgi:hypothetical protein
MGANTGIAAVFITYLMLLHASRVRDASSMKKGPGCSSRVYLEGPRGGNEDS